jgi:hypothetical protein
MRCEEAQRTGWCGYCYAGLRGREAWEGHAGKRSLRPRKERMDDPMLLKRPTKEESKGTAIGATDVLASKEWPVLVEWLTITAWDDGKPRQTGTCMILAESGQWKAWLHDRDLKRAAWCAGDTLSLLLASIERGLANDGLGWRRDK